MIKRIFREYRFLIISLIVVAVLFNIRLPYYVNAPGGTIDISDRTVVEGAKKEQDGSLYMLYVTEYVATVPTYLMSYIFPDWDLEKVEEAQIADESTEEINKRNKIMLNNSVSNAMYVAFKAADKEINIIKKEHLVIATPIKSELQIGDELLEIDNQVVDDLEVVREVIQGKELGDQVEVKIKRNEQVLEKVVEIKEMDGVKALGIVLTTNYEYETDPEVELKFKSSESGSSGGMMMALSIYNSISGEDILKGRKIAGTGTIDQNGTVGEIAGVKYKIMGAYRNGVDIVLVPSGNYEEAVNVAKEKNYDLEIVEVKTFEDAVEYLKNND